MLVLCTLMRAHIACRDSACRGKVVNGSSPFSVWQRPYTYQFMVCGNLPSCGNIAGGCESAQYDSFGDFYRSLGVAAEPHITWQLLDSASPGNGVWCIWPVPPTCGAHFPFTLLHVAICRGEHQVRGWKHVQQPSWIPSCIHHHRGGL